jgi:hypothetical protein
VALKGLLALDIDIDALSIQLYNMSSFRTSIELFRNSSDDEEKTNIPVPKELASGTLTRIITRLRRVYNIKNKF